MQEKSTINYNTNWLIIQNYILSQFLVSIWCTWYLNQCSFSRRLQEALEDVNEAVRLAPQTRDVRRVLIKIRDEMQNELDSCVSIDLAQLRHLAASVDTLSEADLPMTSSILSESGYSSNI